jgi:hypothetical protein
LSAARQVDNYFDKKGGEMKYFISPPFFILQVSAIDDRKPEIPVSIIFYRIVFANFVLLYLNRGIFVTLLLLFPTLHPQSEPHEPFPVKDLSFLKRIKPT